MKLVAEIGSSHNNKMVHVIRMMHETVQADAFKLQRSTSSA